MADRRVKVKFGTELVDGEELSFEAIQEGWNEYACVDGSNVRIKVVVSKITKLVDRKNAMGEPIYIISSSNVVAATPPTGTVG